MKNILVALLLLVVLSLPALAVHAPHAECCFDGDPWCCIAYLIEKAMGMDW